jgi:6-phosphogluconolactonase (cycloisomerase 2 family)
MASKRNSRIEVLRLVSCFIAILGVAAIPTILLAPAALAQGTTTRPASKFAYFADENSYSPGEVAAYTIDSVTGSLTEIPGSPFPAGIQPHSLWADPQGRFLYEEDWFDDLVSVYAIDANTGALSPIPGSPFPDLYPTDAMVGDPTGQFLYTASGAAIIVYTIDPVNGSLTQVGEPYYALAGAVGLAVSPSGKFLYAADDLSGSVGAYALDAISGGLTEIVGSPFRIGAVPSHVAITPSGNFAYVAAHYNNAVFAYAVNTSTGALTEVAGSPFDAGSSPYYVAVDPLGKFLYVANSAYSPFGNDMSISGYAINQTTGALTPIPGSPFPSGVLPHDLNGAHGFTIDLSGRFLYAANYSGFAIDPLTGALTPLSGLPTGRNPMSVTTTGVSATATTLTSSLNPSIYGQAVTWTATVLPKGAIPPTGTVSFTWGSAYRRYTIGTTTLNSSGVATLTRSNLNAYIYPLTAVYRGDANNPGSTSAVLNQIVTQTTSAATLASSPNPSASSQAVTFTATITSPTVRPTGPVTFAVGKTVLGTAQLSGGKAKLTISTLAVGSSRVTATYYGNSNIAKSSASVTQTVNQ